MNQHDPRIRALEDEFKIRFGIGRPGAPPRAGGEFVGMSSVRGVLRRLGVQGRRGGPGGPSRRGGGRGFGGSSRQQRVVIKASYTTHYRADKARGVLRAHVSYLSRDSASLDGERGQFYDRDNGEEEIGARDANLRLKQQEWEQDSRHFRIIISPERGDLIQQHPGGMKQFVREVMERVEKDLNTQLQWLAIDHHNTDEPHAHVLLRGVRENGRALIIPRAYIQHGLRQAVQEIATRWLGERTQEQINEALRKEITAERYTALDAMIERNLDEQRRMRLPAGAEQRIRIAARLQVLERYGLARKQRGRWTVSPELRLTLQDLGVRGDIIKNLHSAIGHRAASVIRFEAAGESPAVAGTIVATGADDELRDRRYLLIRDSQERLHYVRVANREVVSVLEPGGIVRVLATDPHRARTDRRIAEVARVNGGVYSTQAHRRQLSASFAQADAESFLRAHARRMESLSKLGAAIPESGGQSPAPGGWRIAEPDKLAQGEHARSHDGQGIVEIVSARSVQSQIAAEAWTWLDRQIHLQAQGKPTATAFDPALQQAAQARCQWMIERGYADGYGGQYTLRSGAAQALRQKEWNAVVPDLAERLVAPVCSVAAGTDVIGNYRGSVALHGGLYAAVDEGSEVHLAPVRRVPPVSYGSPVRVQVSTRGLAVLSAVMPSLSTSRGAELE